jgi:tRNA uracil 4-sulfurtransferase
MLYDCILIRYGEFVLKGDNQKQFTKRIKEHIKKKLVAYPSLKYKSAGLRFYIMIEQENIDEIIQSLKEIPGIYSFSLVARCSSDLEEIKQTAFRVLANEIQYDGFTFKVETNRADKLFPIKSLDVTQEISRYLFKNIPNLKADLHHPKMVLDIDIRVEGTFIYTKVIKGLGGFPSGTAGKALLMMSGGIDSVVGGYLAIKRGIEVEAIHFASFPHTSKLSEQKVIDLASCIAKYTYANQVKLHVINFTPMQEAIFQFVDEDYVITVMRRMMYRITEAYGLKHSIRAIITGESVGQVASQTLESLATINEPIHLPVIRPLSTYDKEDIVSIAKDIGTYPISIRPYDDCCTVFVPKHPCIRPRVKYAKLQESRFDYLPLIEQALIDVKTIIVQEGHYTSALNQNELHELF